MSQVAYVAESPFTQSVQHYYYQVELLQSELERLEKISKGQTMNIKKQIVDLNEQNKFLLEQHEKYTIYLGQLTQEYQEHLNSKQYETAKEIVTAYVQRENYK